MYTYPRNKKSGSKENCGIAAQEGKAVITHSMFICYVHYMKVHYYFDQFLDATDLFSCLLIIYFLGHQRVLKDSNAKPLGLAQKHLRLKSSKKVDHLVNKPLPRASRSNFYDDHWASKQERGM